LCADRFWRGALRRLLMREARLALRGQRRQLAVARLDDQRRAPVFDLDVVLGLPDRVVVVDVALRLTAQAVVARLKERGGFLGREVLLARELGGPLERRVGVVGPGTAEVGLSVGRSGGYPRLLRGRARRARRLRERRKSDARRQRYGDPEVSGLGGHGDLLVLCKNATATRRARQSARAARVFRTDPARPALECRRCARTPEQAIRSRTRARGLFRAYVGRRVCRFLGRREPSAARGRRRREARLGGDSNGPRRGILPRARAALPATTRCGRRAAGGARRVFRRYTHAHRGGARPRERLAGARAAARRRQGLRRNGVLAARGDPASRRDRRLRADRDARAARGGNRRPLRR